MKSLVHSNTNSQCVCTFVMLYKISENILCRNSILIINFGFKFNIT